ncbi:MAG: alpha-mannosidase, partial [Anaerolineae bacterium]|nr:alpha-mannosidase [Anaerolineae bacterium]
QHINWLNPPDEAFLAGVREARALLHDRIFSQPPAAWRFTPRPTLHAIGHAHIDVAWLWPLQVTRGKATRTFATALALMDQFPAYRFTQSQPHLYKMVAEDDPAMFARIKTRIAEGRWNATGGTWVEPDTFMPGNEALVRQFLYGMRYFERELGVRPEALWLPDVFGYTAALPQLIKLAGMRYFFTSKLSWNKHTRFPYETFWWEGLDGTRILTHLATTPELSARREDIERTTYNSMLTGQEVIETWTRYQQKDANHHLLVAFGMGDGGGGPNRDTLERRARMNDLPGMPRVIHSTVEDFFHALEETIPGDLPHWVGELYLQMHLGTFTSQARTKRHNRKTEVLLHDAEALASTAFLLEGTYPHEAVNAAWETVLLNQFHDILPGSSITPVYEDTERDYAAAQQRAQTALDQALQTLTSHIRWDEDMEGFVVFNTLGMTQGGPVELTLPGEGPVEIVGPSGRYKAYQWIDEDARRVLILPNNVPAYGHKAYIVRNVEQAMPVPVYGPVEGTGERLENEYLRAEFDASGNLIRLYDREFGRDVLADGEIGNQLWAYVDRPPKWDAWDVEPYVQDQGWRLEAESVRLIEAGPLRATLEMTYKFNKSIIVQRVSLLTGNRTLRFDTAVDWHERHIMLKVHFQVAVRATNTSYETQFGTVERPTHTNTMWDFAQHEVPAQQWIDMSEAGYGVSLLNDCKYGHSARSNVLTMSLLRSPTHPDPEADQGQHSFTYALYPHGNDWRNKTITQARRLNHPLHTRTLDGGGTWLPVVWGLVTCDSPGVAIDTIKKAEDSTSLIVRVYEAHGGRTTATMGFSARVETAEEVNLLEEPLGPVNILGDTLRFSLAPFQIRSFRVKLADVVEHQLG